MRQRQKKMLGGPNEKQSILIRTKKNLISRAQSFFFFFLTLEIWNKTFSFLFFFLNGNSIFF